MTNSTSPPAAGSRTRKETGPTPVVLWIPYLPQSQNRRGDQHWARRYRLKKKARPHVARRGGKPSLLITLTACRRPDARRDGDNWAEAGYKELRDVIAKWFGLDDNDRFIKWQYRNLDTIGQQGTIVTMEKL